MNRYDSTGKISINSKRAVGQAHIKFNLTTNHQMELPEDQLREKHTDGKRVIALASPSETVPNKKAPASPIVFSDSETEEAKGGALKTQKVPAKDNGSRGQ